MQAILDEMAAHQPYIQSPNFAYTQQMNAYRNQPYSNNVASTSTPFPPAFASSGPSASLPQSSFRAPAHKHAHHLHSIPPREKSTRTLIIDHMLWVHGRTRFAQARAELGMTDRTGGPTSPNYTHRRRPEAYEEEDEEGSEGEDVVTLKARAGDPHHPHKDDEDDRLGRQDLALARSLRLRAEGLEKVVISMLDQPPPIHPVHDEEILTPPTSPKLAASAHPHRLPNGVRLRLALGTIINDLFARQAPPPPYRHTQAQTPGSTRGVTATPPEQSPPVAPSAAELPSALSTLAPVSGAFVPALETQQQAQRHTRSMQTPPNMQSPHYSDYNSHYQNQSYNQGSPAHMRSMQYHSMQQQQQQQQAQSSQQALQYASSARPHPKPSSRTRALYAVGADPDTANSPPAFRCPRHLHTGCEICVEAKSPARPTGSNSGKSSSSAATRMRPTSFGSGSDQRANNSSWKAMPGGVGPGGGGITGWQDGSGIGSGLLRPGVRGSALRRKVREDEDDAGTVATSKRGTGNTKLSRLIPRFIRLSALVAAELGREARGEEESESTEGGDRSGAQGTSTSATDEHDSNTTPRRSNPADVRYTPPPAPLSSPPVSRSSQTQAQRMYENALRPAREWYMLLAGLLTRAVLEGYLTGGWRGLQAVRCLLLVGLGINESVSRELYEDGIGEDDEEEEFSGLDPDELPDLVEAIKILFPSLRESSARSGGVSGRDKGKGRAEDEYEGEMLERLKRFYDIPASTPDCATHMEDLAWQYPAEPVERAAVRFCEAIAKWRGKPELETYKKKPAARDDAGGMAMDALVHSNPVSPTMGNVNIRGQQGMGLGMSMDALERGVQMRRKKKPSIDVYFMQATAESGSGRQQEEGLGWTRSSGGGSGGNKRYRDVGDDGGRAEKRMYTA